MKKIILSIVALIAILWIAMFVTEMRVLVEEVSPHEGFLQCQAAKQSAEEKGESLSSFDVLFACSTVDHWECTYFNGRSLARTIYSNKIYSACPNIQFGASR